jgi:uncharacterized protein (DUF1778 family)
MQDMAKRTSGDVTIRLGLDERRKLDAVAARHHLPISTWLRQVALRAAEQDLIFDEADRRRRVAKALAALDTDPAPADDLERRRSGWNRKP